MKSAKATGRQLANANVVGGLTVNVAKAQTGDDAAVIASVVNAAKEPNANGAKATARAKRADVKLASVLNANGPEVNLAVRIC
jgi:hypothetical protein